MYGQLRWHSGRIELFTFEQCQIYLADDKTRELVNSQIINRLRSIIAKGKLNCGRKANVYYFADKKQDSSGHMILLDLLSYCPFNSKAPCDTYYLTRYKTQDAK
jgi:hypothetical protein